MVSGVDASAQSLLPLSNINSMAFILLPGWMAYGILMFIQRFLASYFTYKLAKEYLNFKQFPSIIAGLIFSLLNFSMYSFTLYHAFGLPALAFIIWSLEKINVKKKSTSFVYLLCFGILIGFCNYFVYFTPYLLPFIFFWFLYIRNQTSKRLILNLFIFSLGTLLPMIPNILATIYNSQLSQRAIFNLSSEGFAPQGRYLTAFYRIATLVESYYLSVVLIVALLARVRFRSEISKKLAITAIGLSLITFIYKLIQPSLAQIPNVIKSFSFDRFEIIIPFVLALLLGSLITAIPRPSKAFVIFLLLVIFIASLKVKVETVKNYAPYRSLYMHPDLKAASEEIDSSKWRVATVTGGGVRPSYPLSNGLYSVDSYLTLYPKGYHEFWKGVIDKRIANDKSRYEDFVDWGSRVYLYGPNNFDQLNIINFSEFYDLDLLSLANTKYILSMKPLDDPNLILMPSIYRKETSEWGSWRMPQKLKFFLSGKYYGMPIFVYENAKVFPRFFLDKNGKKSDEGIKIINYSPDKIELSVVATNNANLIASINYYPYWEIYINGKKQKIDLYKDTFISTRIKKGDNKVLMFYNPPYRIF